jgi:hypothetical protein
MIENPVLNLINRYKDMPEGEFKQLMSTLPYKLQEHFSISIPSYFSNITAVYNDGIVRRDVMLIRVELRDDEGMLPIPPNYAKTIARMEEILQKSYADSINRSCEND